MRYRFQERRRPWFGCQQSPGVSRRGHSVLATRSRTQARKRKASWPRSFWRKVKKWISISDSPSAHRPRFFWRKVKKMGAHTIWGWLFMRRPLVRHHQHLQRRILQ